MTEVQTRRGGRTYANDGHGKYLWPSGDVYKGDFVNGNFDGHGQVEYVKEPVEAAAEVEAEMKAEKAAEKAAAETKAAEKAAAAEMAAEKAAEKTAEKAPAAWRVGGFKGDKCYGLGVYSCKTGHMYVGEHENDQKHGWGMRRLPNGTLYFGQWRNGLRHGAGVETKPDGATVIGRWEYDQRIISNIACGIGTSSDGKLLWTSRGGEWRGEAAAPPAKRPRFK